MSPTARKRGSVPAMTMGSLTITSLAAWPTFVDVHATAIRRTVPLNAGMSKETSAVPSGDDLDDARKLRERRLGRGRALDALAAPVATRADAPGAALHAVDELAVKVAKLGGEALLVEVMRVGRRRLVAREIEDADIDGRDRDIGLVPRPPGLRS